MSTVNIRLNLPKSLSRQDIEAARAAAFEAAVLELYQQGAISARVAAERLGRTYYDFLEQLARKGIPTAQVYDWVTADQASKRISRTRPRKS